MNQKQYKDGIVITTCEKNKDFLAQCLRSIDGTKYQVLVVGNDGYDPKEHIESLDLNINLITDTYVLNAYEISGIILGQKLFENFFLLPDTCIVKDQKVFDHAFGYYAGVSVSSNYLSFIGKYRSVILDRLGSILPISTANERDIMEKYFNEAYMHYDSQWRALIDLLPEKSEVLQEVHGEFRMVLENEFIIKYKLTK